MGGETGAVRLCGGGAVEQRPDPGRERRDGGGGTDLQQPPDDAAARRQGDRRRQRLERRQAQLVRDRDGLALELRTGHTAGRVGTQHCPLELGELVVEVERNPATGALTAARDDCHRYL